jgi:MbtH protein
MTNPFEDVDATFVVLVNDDVQYSLWPVFMDTPPGWTIVHAADGRQACLDYIEQHWTDMRPRQLAEAMDGGGAVSGAGL